ncbi:MAG TPA: SAM-dependent chlorinase/fluorinase [Panacibacter sp.]|nr:SAM-dependent chlorinase/fluorinase [Panacibacter sp.]
MPALTLSTDIGQSDYLAGAIKGQLISAVPGCTIADITHQLSPLNYQQSAYICRNAFKYFPPGTFHIVLINFFERTPENILITTLNGQYIICPDNGILTMIAGSKPNNIFAIGAPANGNATLLQCTEKIAETIQQIMNGASLQSVANSITGIDEKYPMRSTSGPDWIESQIIFIDNFENVVVNLTNEEFEELRKNRRFRIMLMRNSEFIEKISAHYASVQPGENMAWFNSAGYLEIAINKGNVAGLFGLQGYTENTPAMQNRLLYQTVRILFY